MRKPPSGVFTTVWVQSPLFGAGICFRALLSTGAD